MCHQCDRLLVGLLAICLTICQGLGDSDEDSGSLFYHMSTLAPPSEMPCDDGSGSFRLASCALCYRLTYHEETALTLYEGRRRMLPSGSPYSDGSNLVLDIRNATTVQRICDVTGNRIKCDQWQTCCRKAEECCQRAAIRTDPEERFGCPRVWDGYTCWPETEGGVKVSRPCPEYVAGFNQSASVTRTCTPEGVWQAADKSHVTSTDYDSCWEKDTGDLHLDDDPEDPQRSTASSDLNDFQNETEMCRYWDGYTDRLKYELITCSHCYKYLFPDGTELFPYGIYLVSLNGTRLAHGTLIKPDINNATLVDIVCQTLKSRTRCRQWLDCCRAARLCCDAQLDDVSWTTGGSRQADWCPGTWDGYACWDKARPGSVEQIACPGFIPHAMPSAYAVKTCTENGTWFRSETNKEWTNYTACLRFDEFKVNIYIKITCSSLSLLALIPSVAIFLSYGTLRSQHRVRLHINLFVSFIFYAFINILWEILVVYERMSKESTTSRMAGNTADCKFLYVLTRYSRSTNFIWMFCEGLYLHRLIVKAFQPPSKLTLFYIIGWAFPWLPVGIYAILRIFVKDENCWVQHIGGYEWIIYIPNLMALIANLAFLIDILRILLTQLQSHPNEPSNYRRALKATFVLVPLFGLQLFVIIYRPPLGSRAGIIYENIAAIIVNSQGFFVALIFCLINGEVLSHLRRTCIRLGCYKATSLARNGNYTMTTQASDVYTRESPTSSFRAPPDGNIDKRTDYIALKPMANNNGNLK